MSEIHIGPHTHRDEKPHGPGEPHHTYDREIDLKSIAKWMLGLLMVTVVVQVLMWWLIEGIERFDEKQDPELTPIQKKVEQQAPPAPRLQVTPGFAEHNENAIASSELEDMQLLREREDKVLDSPSWIDQGQGRVRVPIDVAMQVIVSRGAEGTGVQPPAGTEAQPAAAPEPPASQEQRR